jgi:N6-adenosine-specific RNA methylase IME4
MKEGIAVKNTDDIRIDPELASLMPALKPEERERLEAAILCDGCRDPLVVWAGRNALLDGRNRLRICRRHGLPYGVREIDLPDRLAAMLWIRENQAGRRNLTDDQRAMNAAAIKDLLAEQAKAERAKKAGKTGGRGRQSKNSLSETCADKIAEPKRDTRKRAAKQQRVSEWKVRQASAVRRADPALAKQVFDGEVPLAAAVREVKRRETEAKLESVEAKEAKAAEGVYDVLVIDPPWPMQKIERDCRPNQSLLDYPTMTEAELRELAVPAADDCHVWLWTTHKFLPMAFRLLDAWGLKYVCTFVWHKPGGFQPVGLPQYNCEFALYARKGRPKFLDTKAFPVCFSAPRGRHSEKPEAFYEAVRRVTAGRRLDMFSRRRIDGFDGWGKEAE